jgi:hypothetical protein
MGYATRKYEKGQAQRPWKVHPVWRGIGCLLAILIPVMAWAGAALLIQDNTLFTTPERLNQPVIIRYTEYRFANQVIQWLNTNLGGRGLTYAQVVYWVVLMLVGFLLLVILYGVFYRLIGPPKYGPTDSPPIGKGTRR